jgi:AbrB family looped-hinge helix DNA binding protein
MPYGNDFAMSICLSIDKAGRVVLPKEIRVRLHLEPGDLLDADLGVDEVRLRPRHAALSGISHVEGRMVWDAPGASASVGEIEHAVRRGRSERDSRASGL